MPRINHKTVTPRKPEQRASETRVRRRNKREKVSTTIAPENYVFLQDLIRAGTADSISQALDLVLDDMRSLENRRRNEAAMVAFYDNASPEAVAEENELAADLSASVSDLLFDE